MLKGLDITVDFSGYRDRLHIFIINIFKIT